MLLSHDGCRRALPPCKLVSSHASYSTTLRASTVMNDLEPPLCTYPKHASQFCGDFSYHSRATMCKGTFQSARNTKRWSVCERKDLSATKTKSGDCRCLCKHTRTTASHHQTCIRKVFSRLVPEFFAGTQLLEVAVWPFTLACSLPFSLSLSTSHRLKTVCFSHSQANRCYFIHASVFGADPRAPTFFSLLLLFLAIVYISSPVASE